VNENYYINQINHLRAIIDGFENKDNNIYNIMNETIDETFWVADLDLKFNFISASIKKILGYSYDELANKSIEDYLVDGSADELKKKLENEIRYIKKNPDKNQDYFERLILCFKHKTKDINVWCEVKIRFLLNDKLEPVSILGTAKDITEQKLIEETLYKNFDMDNKELLQELEKTKKELEETKKELEELKNK